MIGKTIHKQLEKERFDFNKAHTLLPSHHKNRGLNAERSMYVCMHNQTHTQADTEVHVTCLCDIKKLYVYMIFGGDSGKEPACQSRRGR